MLKWNVHKRFSLVNCRYGCVRKLYVVNISSLMHVYLLANRSSDTNLLGEMQKIERKTTILTNIKLG